ncbi:MAG: M20/M25/M40 family metallo-hydrolase [Candidatus Aminicenantes bacterium]|nr:M20/M25/M40 family metallo-hydrolase [Candidatus Aminicenantes bacterium]
MNYQQFFRSRRGEMVGFLKQLVLAESPTSDKKAVDACSAIFLANCGRHGVRHTRFPQRGRGDFHLLEYPARDDDRLDGRLLVLTHIDTVWPVGRLAKMPFYLQGDKIFGPGVLDMKAGLVLAASALGALRELNLRPRRRIAMFLNSAEETGSEEAHEIIRAQAKAADRVLCLEPALPGGALKIQRKGRLVIRLDVHGIAAHGGSPGKGVSAIDELICLIRKIEALRSADVSVNIGLIGGGEKANIVAESAFAVGDIRFWTAAQRDKILAVLKALGPSVRRAKVKTTIESTTPPMERTKGSDALFAEARSVAAELGMKITGGKTGGGSDASIAAGLGRPTLDGLGPDGDGIHAAHEHALLSSLVDRAALLTALFLKI